MFILSRRTRKLLFHRLLLQVRLHKLVFIVEGEVDTQEEKNLSLTDLKDKGLRLRQL